MATLGKTAVGASSSSWPTGYLEVAGPYTASENGTPTSVSLYVAGNVTDANPVRGVIYLDSAGVPGALVALGAAVTVTAGQAAGWITSTISTGSITNGSKYWVGFMPGGGPNGCSFYKDTVGGSARYVTVTYPTAPDPFGSPTTYTDELSAYITYTPAAGNVSVTGVRATATATGKTGSPKDVPSRARAAATAAGKSGSPKVQPSNVRATATAAGRAGTAKVCVTGVRALATAAGKSGSVSVGGSILLSGARAVATAAGRAGSPRVVLPGARAAAPAVGKTGSPRVRLTGPRAQAAGAGTAGTVHITNGGNVATPRLTSRTRVRLITL